MRHALFAAALVVILPALSASAAPAAKPAPAAETKNLTGGCSQHSSTTYGGLKAAPGDQHTLFTCDNLSVTFTDAKRRHVVLEFGLKGKKDAQLVGFEGMLDEFGKVKVQKMYLDRGIVNVVDEGDCFLGSPNKDVFSATAINAAQCKGAMHQGKNRWEALIDFRAIK